MANLISVVLSMWIFFQCGRVQGWQFYPGYSYPTAIGFLHPRGNWHHVSPPGPAAQISSGDTTLLPNGKFSYHPAPNPIRWPNVHDGGVNNPHTFAQPTPSIMLPRLEDIPLNEDTAGASSLVTATFHITDNSDRIAVQPGVAGPHVALYPAPPSYDRSKNPSPSIVITSRPLVMNEDPKNQHHRPAKPFNFPPAFNLPEHTSKGLNTSTNFHHGIVKISPQVVHFSSSFTMNNGGEIITKTSPSNIKTTPSPLPIWKLKPKLSEAIRRFLPELKYYQKGLKSVDPRSINSTVERFVLISPIKSEDEMMTATTEGRFPPQSYSARGQGPRAEASLLKQDHTFDQSKEESSKVNPNTVIKPQVQDFDIVTPPGSIDRFTTEKPTGENKLIEDIVKEVFATVTPLTIEDNIAITVKSTIPVQETESVTIDPELNELLQILFRRRKIPAGTTKLIIPDSTPTVAASSSHGSENTAEPLMPTDIIWVNKISKQFPPFDHLKGKAPESFRSNKAAIITEETTTETLEAKTISGASDSITISDIITPSSKQFTTASSTAEVDDANYSVSDDTPLITSTSKDDSTLATLTTANEAPSTITSTTAKISSTSKPVAVISPPDRPSAIRLALSEIGFGPISTTQRCIGMWCYHMAANEQNNENNQKSSSFETTTMASRPLKGDSEEQLTAADSSLHEKRSNSAEAKSLDLANAAVAWELRSAADDQSPDPLLGYLKAMWPKIMAALNVTSTASDDSLEGVKNREKDADILPLRKSLWNLPFDLLATLTNREEQDHGWKLEQTTSQPVTSTTEVSQSPTPIWSATVRWEDSDMLPLPPPPFIPPQPVETNSIDQDEETNTYQPLTREQVNHLFHSLGFGIGHVMSIVGPLVPLEDEKKERQQKMIPSMHYDAWK